MDVVQFETGHLELLKVHKYMEHIQKDFGKEYRDFLAKFPAYTAMVDGKAVACAGMVQTGVYRWQAWALISKDSGKHMLHLTRAIKHYMKNLSTPRIETHVRADFEAGIRWIEVLGFKRETPEPMKNWGDDGYDYYLYARTI